MTPKKTVAKKAAKKAVPKKASPKKAAARKAKAKVNKAMQKDFVPPAEIEETAVEGDCMCKQKRANGKFFSFSLVQGRWIQSSGVPFPTKELCEEANC